MAEALLARPRGRPRKSPQALDEGNRRQELIAAAARLFRQQGFAGTTVRDIAAAVGMRSGSPFYHFESKEALLGVVMEEGMRAALRRQHAAMNALPEGASARTRLRTLVRAHFDVILGPDSDFIPVMLYEWRFTSPAQRAAVQSLKSQYEARWLPVLQDLHAQRALVGDVRVASLLIFGALNWSVQWWRPPAAVAGLRPPPQRRGIRPLDLEALSEAALQLFIREPAR